MDTNTYYRHLVFANSLTPTRYHPSRAIPIAPSELKAVNGKLPVSTAHFLSPPNALELTWCSRSGGNWSAEIHVERWRGRAADLQGDSLRFWLYSTAPIAVNSLPMVMLILRDGHITRPLRLSGLTADIPANQWVKVQIPFDVFEPSPSVPDWGQLRTVVFTQSIDDGEPHTLYVDEIKVVDSTVAATPATPPSTLTARAYDRHVDLTWEPDPTVAYYRIYRSTDGRSFDPIGIQNPTFKRYTDYLGATHTTAHYRISAVNHHDEESTPSPTVSATTHPMSDDELLTMVQEAHFRYYWEHAHPNAGLALECIPGDEHLIALGASGFGLMAILVGVERGFISRGEAVQHFHKVLAFLDNADRFHGVWPHFLDGRTGRVVAFFGQYDNGGDLVETAFMMQALLTARQYFDYDTEAEAHIRTTITRLWEDVEWNWYRHPADPHYLFWHWSPNHEWHINHPLIGWNETMIAYLLAVASPTHPIPPELYYTGWASQSERARIYRENWGKTAHGNRYSNGQIYYGLELPVGVGSGGPLFFTHYSYLGFDPRGKRDRYANYFENNRLISLINHRYCVENPAGYVGYSADCWGLTASDDHTGYLAHEPTPQNDNGTITPTGALSAFPYTPAESMRALKHFYYEQGHLIWDIYGFRDAFNLTEDYISTIFMGLNQAPIVVMIENYRTGLLWKLFMANPEIRAMLNAIGFVADETPAH